MWRILLLLIFTALFSCRDKVICSAFQSTYILDDSTRNSYYSYVWQLDEVTRAQYLAQQSSGQRDDSPGIVGQPKTDYYAYAGEKVVPWRTPNRTKYGIVKYELTGRERPFEGPTERSQSNGVVLGTFLAQVVDDMTIKTEFFVSKIF